MNQHIIIVLFLLKTVYTKIEEIPLPKDIQVCFDRQFLKGNLTTYIGEKLIWHCVHGTLWTRLGTDSKMPPEAMQWFTDLIQKQYREAEHRRRVRRQATRRRQSPGQLRVRREYRLLTDTERQLFHRALNMLKYDRTIPPNRFDALGRMHELLGERAHDGPNFLGWHRLFLVLAENALREKIPSVTIPYWDSTLDGELVDPRSSIIWTAAFMGNGNGRIRNGPFMGWETPYGPLMRNFGDGGTTMNWTSIRDTFTMSHLAEITYPQADPKANLEDHHGEPHLWVGGHFAPQALAAYDPIFLLHHSFIDLVWEIFRRIQRRRGVNPMYDYPMNNTGPQGQAFYDPSGFGTLQNRHALSDIFTTEMYTYQLPPTCSRESPTCGSPYIRCNTSTSRPKCVSASIFDTPDDEIFNVDNLVPLRKKRNTESENKFINNYKEIKAYLKNIEAATDIKCQADNINVRYENNFNLDGVTDPDGWSYIPVNVILKTKLFNDSYGLNRNVAAVYPKCRKYSGVPHNIFIEANGINYRGLFKEIVHIQNRAPLDIESKITYIGIRTPDKKPSDVLLSAYDSCGRACRPFCRDETRNVYRPCVGSLRIDSSGQKHYGRDTYDISRLLWRSNEWDVPKLNEPYIFVKFVCDDNPNWFW